MSPFALDIIVRASALLAAAALADLVLRRPASAATRHLVWTLAIGALLALPSASSVLPEWTVPVPLAQRFAPFDGVQGRSRVPGAAVPATAVVTPDVASHAAPMPCFENGRRCEPDPPPSGASALANVPRLTPALSERTRVEGPAAALAALYLVYAAGVVLLLARLVAEPFA